MSGFICDRRTAARVKGLRDGSEPCDDAWSGDGGNDKKTGGGVEDVKIFIESDQDGQD